MIATVVIEEALKDLAYLFVSSWGHRWLRSIRRFPILAQRRLGGLIRLTMFLIFLSILPRVSSLMSILYERLYEVFTSDFTIGTVELSLMNISALAASGLELSRLTLVMSALGIGFGLHNIVNNFVSGLVLAFEQPFQVSDIIETDTLTGHVRLIGLRASRVRTLDGAEVIVPNADLIAGNVVNWTLSDRMRHIDVDVGVAYASDPGNVRSILIQVAEKTTT